MKLSERKTKILKALVDCYIDTAEPVSSAVLRDRYIKDLSSATIRNELAALEEMGFVAQPHTSAGRVPLSPAYKLYAEDLFGKGKLTKRDVSLIEQRLEDKLSAVEDITKRTAEIISDVTNYTSFVIINNLDDVMVKEVKLVDLSDGTALVVIITDKGALTKNTVSLPENARGEQLAAATQVINSIFAGRNLKLIVENNDITDECIDIQMQEYRDLFENVLQQIKNYAKTGEMVFVEGALKMLDYPEYQRIEDAKNFLQVVSDKEKVASLALWKDDIEFSIKVGPEDGVSKSAVVTVKYKIDGKEVGQAGVIGPERMDYGKVISVLEYLGNGRAGGGYLESDKAEGGADADAEKGAKADAKSKPAKETKSKNVKDSENKKGNKKK